MIIEERAIILSVRKFQESKLIIKCFFENSGVITGLTRLKGKFAQAPSGGTVVKAKWNARLEEHLGFIEYQQIKDVSASVSYDYRGILVLNSALNLIEALILEKQGHNSLFNVLHKLILNLEHSDILKKYAIFEVIYLLNEIGFGLELSKCVVSRKSENLCYVSPNSSSAVSYEIGKPYHDKLFKLPSFLIDHNTDATTDDIMRALRISTFFLNKHIFKPFEKQIPISRNLLIEYVNKLL